MSNNRGSPARNLLSRLLALLIFAGGPAVAQTTSVGLPNLTHDTNPTASGYLPEQPAGAPNLQWIRIGQLGGLVSAGSGSNPFGVGAIDVCSVTGAPPPSSLPPGSICGRTDTQRAYVSEAPAPVGPAVVQTFSANGLSNFGVTLSAAPTAGDYLVAQCSWTGAQPTAASGWTTIASHTPTAAEAYALLVYARAIASTAQNPCQAPNAGSQGTVGIVEVANLSGTWATNFVSSAFAGSTHPGLDMDTSTISGVTPGAKDLVLGFAFALGSNGSSESISLTSSGWTIGQNTSGFVTAQLSASQSLAAAGSSYTLTTTSYDNYGLDALGSAVVVLAPTPATSTVPTPLIAETQGTSATAGQIGVFSADAQMTPTTLIPGTPTAGDCVQWLAGSELGDAGAACGSGSGGSGGATPTTVYFTAADIPPATAGSISDEFNGSGVSSAWLWQNQGTSSDTESSGYLHLTATLAGGGDTWHVLYRAVPATPWTVTVKYFFHSAGMYSNFVYTGIAVMDTSFKMLTCGEDNGSDVLAQYWNSQTSFNGTLIGSLHQLYGLRYKQVSDDGINLYCRTSTDGLTWSTVWQAPRTAFLSAPAYVGVGLGGNMANGADYLDVDYFRSTSP